MSYWCCYGCGVVLDESEFEMVEDDEGDADGIRCPECESTDTGELEF